MPSRTELSGTEGRNQGPAMSIKILPHLIYHLTAASLLFPERMRRCVLSEKPTTSPSVALNQSALKLLKRGGSRYLSLPDPFFQLQVANDPIPASGRWMLFLAGLSSSGQLQVPLYDSFIPAPAC